MTTPATPLPEPSYTRVVLIRIAEHLARQDPAATVTEAMLRRAFTVGVAQELQGLPPAEADEAIDKVNALLPDLAADPTVGSYVGQLRQIAQGLT